MQTFPQQHFHPLMELLHWKRTQNMKMGYSTFPIPSEGTSTLSWERFIPRPTAITSEKYLLHEDGLSSIHTSPELK